MLFRRAEESFPPPLKYIWFKKVMFLIAPKMAKNIEKKT
jgi:hypothetical protein